MAGLWRACSMSSSRGGNPSTPSWGRRGRCSLYPFSMPLSDLWDCKVSGRCDLQGTAQLGRLIACRALRTHACALPNRSDQVWLSPAQSSQS